MTMRELIHAVDRLPLGTIMPAAFATALAFALYAAPGLPPGSARGLLMLLAAAVGGGAVWALFAWLERPRTSAPKREVEDAAPTLRRADAHPDAPARRPIFAAADLGAPLDEAPALRGEPALKIADADDELLLDQRADALPPSPLRTALPESSAALIARLEDELRRRGRSTPPSKLTLRNAIVKLQASV